MTFEDAKKLILYNGNRIEYEQKAAELYSESLHKEIAKLKIQLSNYAYQIDMAKRERDNAVNQYLDQRALNQSIAKQITDLKSEIERLNLINHDRRI